MSGSWTSAHRRDEYLQAARLAIDPDRVELALDLTPGIAVADVVLVGNRRRPERVDLRRRGSGYADRVLSAIALDVDGIPLRVELTEIRFPPRQCGRGRHHAHITQRRRCRDSRTDYHLRYRNAYRADIGVYLANALVPASDRVIVSAQRRDIYQRDLVIDYQLSGQPAPTARRGLSVGVAGALILIANLWWRTRTRQMEAL